MEKVSVLIPAYNEEQGIPEVLSQIDQFIPYAEREIIVIDDASQDKTKELAKVAGAKVISNPVNMGYGFSLKRGFREAQYECVLIVDGDGTYPIENFSDLLAKYNAGFDMVIGARSGQAYWTSLTKKIARLCFQWMSEFVVGEKIPDINSGFRIVRKSKIVPLLSHLSNRFSFSTSSTLIFLLKHYFVGYVPIQYHVRKGKTKVKYFRDALRTTQIMIDIIASYNPIKLFLLIALFPFVISTAFLILYLFQYNSQYLLIFFLSLFFSILLLSLGFFVTIFRQK